MRIWNQRTEVLRVAAIGFLALLLGTLLGAPAQAQPVPVYKADASWPKMPLPNKWMMQGVPTMVADKDDHIWVISRPRDITADESGAGKTPPRNDCCIAAPAILEFDMQGNLLKSWGGPEYVPVLARARGGPSGTTSGTRHCGG